MNKKTLLAYSMLLTSLVSKNTNCWFFAEMDKHFQQMERRMANMRKIFGEMEEQFYKEDSSQTMRENGTKSKIGIDQKDDTVLINLDLGKGIKDFDAKIKIKKDGYSKDQIIIKIEQPKKQKIVITSIGNYLCINKTAYIKEKLNEKKCQRKKCKKCKKQYSSFVSKSSFTTGRTLDKKVDIEKAKLEYDANEGILSVIIPKEKIEEPQGKTIDIKINKAKAKLDGK